jgi:hypothetical protein
MHLETNYARAIYAWRHADGGGAIRAIDTLDHAEQRAADLLRSAIPEGGTDACTIRVRHLGASVDATIAVIPLDDGDGNPLVYLGEFRRDLPADPQWSSVAACFVAICSVEGRYGATVEDAIDDVPFVVGLTPPLLPLGDPTPCVVYPGGVFPLPPSSDRRLWLICPDPVDAPDAPHGPQR